MLRNPNAEPKPFVLIDIPSSEAPKRKPAVTHETFSDLTGRLELTFTVKSAYLFVGSGIYEFDPNRRNQMPDVWYTFYRRAGQICVPGTSVKGAIRALVEAISNSCVTQWRRKRRNKEYVRSNHHQPCEFKNETSLLCPACRLFGTTSYRGRVHFTDFLPQGEVELKIVKIGELWEPRRFDPGKRRFYEQKTFKAVGNLAPERGFRFVEAVREAAKFRGALLFENLSEEELGLVLHALGLQVEDGQVDTAFCPKLGGAKPRCFGSVDFRPIRLRLWSQGGDVKDLKDLLAPQEVQGKDLVPLLSRYLQACRDGGLLHEASWNALKKGFRPKSGEQCPQGVY